MRVVHSTTTTSAPVLSMLAGGRSPELYGVIATYAESSTYYIKFWYQGNTNAAPVLGVTAPTLTIPISAGAPGYLTAIPVVLQGPLWWTATANVSDTDTTALGTGGDVINIFID